MSHAARSKAAQAPLACSWDRPGHQPFMGDIVAAVDRYTDIPAAARERLKQRMQARQYDEFVTIRRDSIDGSRAYDPRISQMHFGAGQVCDTVDRSRWTTQMSEGGLVYCEGEQCVLVPTVCRNVSRVSLRPTAVAPATVAGGSPPAGPLLYEPPGAGPLGGGGGGDTFEKVTSEPPPLEPPPGTPPPDKPPLWPPWSPPTPPYVPPVTPPPPVPEPDMAALWLAGLVGLAAFVRSVKRRHGRAGAARCATQKRS